MILGGSVGLMHFMGMHAMRFRGVASLDRSYVIAAILVGGAGRPGADHGGAAGQIVAAPHTRRDDLSSGPAVISAGAASTAPTRNAAIT